jgi:hypothetical protein
VVRRQPHRGSNRAWKEITDLRGKYRQASVIEGLKSLLDNASRYRRSRVLFALIPAQFDFLSSLGLDLAYRRGIGISSYSIKI